MAPLEAGTGFSVLTVLCTFEFEFRNKLDGYRVLLKMQRRQGERGSSMARKMKQAAMHSSCLGIFIRKVQRRHHDAGSNTGLEARIHDGHEGQPQQDVLWPRKFPRRYVGGEHKSQGRSKRKAAPANIAN